MGTLKPIRRLALTCTLLMAAAQVTAQTLVVGGDMSLLPKYEERGVRFLRQNGLSIADVLKYVKTDAVGWNAVRCRLFVNPATDGDPSVCQNLDYVTAFGKRIKDEGMAFMLDFHYSDTWADPAHQTVPKAWEGAGSDAGLQEVHEGGDIVLAARVDASVVPQHAAGHLIAHLYVVGCGTCRTLPTSHRTSAPSSAEVWTTTS